MSSIRLACCFMKPVKTLGRQAGLLVIRASRVERVVFSSVDSPPSGTNLTASMDVRWSKSFVRTGFMQFQIITEGKNKRIYRISVSPPLAIQQTKGKKNKEQKKLWCRHRIQPLLPPRGKKSVKNKRVLRCRHRFPTFIPPKMCKEEKQPEENHSPKSSGEGSVFSFSRSSSSVHSPDAWASKNHSDSVRFLPSFHSGG